MPRIVRMGREWHVLGQRRSSMVVVSKESGKGTNVCLWEGMSQSHSSLGCNSHSPSDFICHPFPISQPALSFILAPSSHLNPPLHSPPVDRHFGNSHSTTNSAHHLTPSATPPNVSPSHIPFPTTHPPPLLPSPDARTAPATTPAARHPPPSLLLTLKLPNILG